MRLSLFLTTLTAIISLFVVNTIASPGVRCLSEYCPNTNTPEPREPPARTPTPTRHLSNGERLARGLPLKPPTRRSRVAARHASPSPSPVAVKRGVVKVTDTLTGKILGYISKNSYDGAQTRYQPSINDALVVQLTVKAGTTSSRRARITTENSDMTGFPLLALVQGRDNSDANLLHGSYNHVYIGGMELPGSPPDSTPVYSPTNSYKQGAARAAESDVWSINLDTNALTPQWINTDGSKPPVYTFSQGSALYVGGDIDAFNAKFPSSVARVSFTFILL